MEKLGYYIGMFITGYSVLILIFVQFVLGFILISFIEKIKKNLK